MKLPPAAVEFVRRSRRRPGGPPAIVPIEGPEVLDLDLLGVAVGEADVDGRSGRDVPASKVVLRGDPRGGRLAPVTPDRATLHATNVDILPLREIGCGRVAL